jgi:outer membrane protein
MHKIGFTGWTLAAVLAFAALQALAQQDEGPILRPKKPVVNPASATLLVICDLACNWKLDGKERGRIAAGDSTTTGVSLGQHLLVAATTDGLDKIEKELDIEAAKQSLVRIELAPVRDARLKARQDASAKDELENKPALPDPADELWNRMKDSKIAEDFDDYCAQFANSPHCSVARGIAAHLRREAAAASTHAEPEPANSSSTPGREETNRILKPPPGDAATQPLRIAVIAFQVAVGQTNEGQRAISDLQKRYEPKKQQLKALSDEIDNQKKQLQSQGDGLSDADRASLASTIEEKEKQLKREAEEAQSDYQQEMQKVYNTLASKIYDSMKDYARDLGYTQILDVSGQQTPVLFAETNTNITKGTIDAYNLSSGNAASASPQNPAAARVPASLSRVAVIAFQSAVAQTNEGKRDFSDLQKKYEPKKQQLKALNDEIDNLTKRQQEQSAHWSESEQQSIKQTLDYKKKQAQRLLEDAKNDYQQDMQKMYNSVAAKVYDVMVGYVKAQGYTLVLDSSEAQGGKPSDFILYSADSNMATKEALVAAGADITQETIQAYNLKSGVPQIP